MKVTVTSEKPAYKAGDVVMAVFQPATTDKHIFPEEAELVGKRCKFQGVVDQGGDFRWVFEEPQTEFRVCTGDLMDIEIIGNVIELETLQDNLKSDD